MPKLTQSVVQELLLYDPATGQLWWQTRARHWFKSAAAWKTWNTRYAGREALIALSEGYKVGRLFDRLHKAHRVIWLYMQGVWPEADVDHENLQRDDNRWDNLRDLSHAFNSRNQGIRSTNTSGVRGVKWNAATSSWRAQIHVGGKSRHLGLFPTLEKAAAARHAAVSKAGGYNS